MKIAKGIHDKQGQPFDVCKYEWIYSKTALNLVDK